MKGQEFLQSIEAYKAKQDWDGLLSLYHDDAQVISFDFVLHGKAAIKAHLLKTSKIAGHLVGASMDYFTESTDVVMYKGTIQTESLVLKADSAYYLKAGKIFREMVLTIPPDKTKEWAFKDVTPMPPKDGHLKPGEKFYQEHLGYLARGDIDGLLRDHYHEDAEMVTFAFILKGRAALKKYFTEDFPKVTGQILGLSTDYFAEAEDVIMYKGSVKTEKFGVVKGDDAFYIENGKILRHIALTIPPEKTKEWAMKELRAQK